ncbi:MAG: gliding motility protein GldN [Bacteroidia bacterium]|nr:gliding motility protein GldN [Bacteroidia bacterium]
MKKKIVSICLLLAVFLNVKAQGVYDDFIYNRQAVKERKVVAWPYLREADVTSSKRVVRMIDVREKQNQVMAWPKNPLAVIVYESIKSGKMVPYRDDSLNGSYTMEDILKMTVDTSYVENPDPNDPEQTIMDTVYNDFKPIDRIKRYRVVEDWIFDKKLSTYFVRIIAIAPQFKPIFGGVELNEQDLCVLKYHAREADPMIPVSEMDLRHLFINYEVFNRQNDAARVTFDDWFESRQFSSYIIKQSNEQDLYIKDRAEFKDNGVAAILEGERIKQDLFEKEHDMWEY